MRFFVMLFFGILPVVRVVYADQALDVNIVERTIYREDGVTKEGMLAIARVIAQRSIEGKINPSRVCLQRKQFSCWNKATAEDKQFKPLPKCWQAEYAHSLAVAIVTGKDLDRSAIGFANHYCRVDCYPKWAEGVKPVAIIGDHKFFKL